MNMNRNEILTPSRTWVYLAPVGTEAPEDPRGPFPAAWRNVGHTTPDSLQFETSPEFEEVRSAASDYVVKKFQTTDAATVQVDLQQWNGKNFQAVHDGGKLTTTGNVTRFTPPRIGERTDLACLIHVREGGHDYLYVMPVTSQSEGVSQALSKGTNPTLPLRRDVLGGDDTDAWYMLTNDPSFEVPAA